MEKFVGTKIVLAAPISKHTFAKMKNRSDLLKEKDEYGYLVQYENGYLSWLPQEVFKDAYRRIDNMNFGLAIEVLKRGYKIARQGWNGKNMWLWYVREWSGEINTMPDPFTYYEGQSFIVMKTDDKLVPWVASQTDILAEDWQIVE